MGGMDLNSETRARAAHDAVRGPALEDVLSAYLGDLSVRVGESHFKNVAARLRRTLDALECEFIGDLRAVDIIELRNRFKAAGSANRTANLVVDSLRAMLGWAVEVGMIPQSPLPPIRRLPETRDHQRYRRRALREEEVARFLAAAEADDLENEASARDEGLARVPQLPLWLALLETGARWSELRQVRRRDIDVGRRMMVLRADTTKSRRPRAIPLRGEMVCRLDALRDVHAEVLARPVKPGDRVFLSPTGSPWRTPTTNAMRILDRLLIRAGIPKVDEDGEKVDIHALRHCFASRLARGGVGLMQAQRLLGHADPKTTAQIYAHLETEDLRAAIDGLPPLAR